MKKNSFFNTFFLILYFLFINSLSFAEEWFTSSGNYNSLKYSKIKDINQNNLSDLEVAWIYKNGLYQIKILTLEITIKLLQFLLENI